MDVPSSPPPGVSRPRAPGGPLSPAARVARAPFLLASGTGERRGMSIVNRRNAVLGWAAWKLGKTVVKQKARSAVPGTVDGTKRPNKGAILSMLAAAGGAPWLCRTKGTAGAA